MRIACDKKNEEGRGGGVGKELGRTRRRGRLCRRALRWYKGLSMMGMVVAEGGKKKLGVHVKRELRNRTKESMSVL